jgi:hypothetical protein
MSEQNNNCEDNTGANTCINACESNNCSFDVCLTIKELNNKITMLEEYQNRRYNQVIKELNSLYDIIDGLNLQLHEITQSGILDNCCNDYNDNIDGCGCDENSICGCNCNSSFTSNFSGNTCYDSCCIIDKESSQFDDTSSKKTNECQQHNCSCCRKIN